MQKSKVVKNPLFLRKLLALLKKAMFKKSFIKNFD